MEAARWNRIEELLQAALDLAPGERAAYLDEACGSDRELRTEVEALLAQESDGAALSQFPSLAVLESPPGLLSGQKVSHYRLEQRIGAGGMGEVYEARDESLQRVVALKVLPGEFVDDADRVRRFEQEALAASRLNHPNIITIFEVLHSEGSHFIATERVEGQTLRELMTQPLGAEKALDIAIQIALALKAAHTAWIIHRDIKPENIMVRTDGLVKVLDFGIAKLSEEPAQPAVASVEPRSSPNLTVPGAVLGTANYMSPEQARGEPLDGRTDLYSLGLVLHEMLTGHRLRETGDSAAGIRRTNIPRDLDRILRKLLRKDRDERYSSASDLLDDLHRAKRHLESRSARRMVGFSALAVVVALAVAGIAAFLSVNETWEERVLRDGHTAAARQAVFSPDGKTVVSCGEDGQVIVWDFARRERMATLDHPSHKVAYAPNGKWLVTGGTDGMLGVWDTQSWKLLRKIQAYRHEVAAMTFSPDSTRLATAGDTDDLWNTSRWERERQWGRGSSHGNFVFSPDMRQLMHHGEMTVMDLDGEGLHANDPRSGNWLALSPDATQLVVIEPTGMVGFFHLRKRGDLDAPVRRSRQHGHQDHGRSAAYSPDGTLVATGAEDILLWDAATQQKVARFEYSSIVWSVAFSPDGRWLLSTHGDGAVLIWDVKERECAASLNEHSRSVRAVAVSPDGRRVASGGEDRVVTIWNLENGRKEAVFSGHTTRVTAVDFFSDGASFASADQNSVVHLWDLAGAEPRATFRGTANSTYCLDVSPDGRYLATTHMIRDRSGRVVLDFQSSQVYGVKFSPDGRKLVTVETDGQVTIFDVRTFKRLARQRVPDTRQITVSFSPDGKFLATGEDQGAVRLWSVEPLRELGILGRHAARVKSVVFSPDGQSVASAGDDKMIALWDVRARKLRTRIGTHVSPIYALAFSPDGRRLVSGEHDRTVRVYARHRTLWGWELE